MHRLHRCAWSTLLKNGEAVLSPKKTPVTRACLLNEGARKTLKPKAAFGKTWLLSEKL
jgi:hypothetical protein